MTMRSMKLRQRRILAALAGAALFASTSLLAACKDEPSSLGEAAEELGDEIKDEIDDHS